VVSYFERGGFGIRRFALTREAGSADCESDLRNPRNAVQPGYTPGIEFVTKALGYWANSAKRRGHSTGIGIAASMDSPSTSLISEELLPSGRPELPHRSVIGLKLRRSTLRPQASSP
jgi:hypothetical protein